MFYLMVIIVAFTTADGKHAELRLENNQKFETRALCDAHMPIGLAQVQAMVNLPNFPIPEAKTGTFTPECVTETRGA